MLSSCLLSPATALFIMRLILMCDTMQFFVLLLFVQWAIRAVRCPKTKQENKILITV